MSEYQQYALLLISSLVTHGDSSGYVFKGEPHGSFYYSHLPVEHFTTLYLKAKIVVL